MEKQDMENYNKILEELEEVEKEGNVNIYCDDVEIEYDYDLTKMHDKNATAMDTIYSDGKLGLINSENGKCSFVVNNGSYVIIKTIEKDDKENLKVINYSIITTRAVYGYMQAKCLNDNRYDLYERITKNYFKGTLDNYKYEDSNKSVTISPKTSLEKNKKQKH